MGTGTAMTEYQAVKMVDGTITLFMHHAITAMMPQYDLKSFEELRLEDYTIVTNKACMSIVPERCSRLGVCVTSRREK